jgi:hypothetical protein
MSQNTLLIDDRLVQVISASKLNSIEDVINVMQGLDTIFRTMTE